MPSDNVQLCIRGGAPERENAGGTHTQCNSESPRYVRSFWRRVDRSGGADACWPWMRARNTDGYGRLWDNNRRGYAHRVAWRLVNGPIPPGLDICHTCDNQPCCNPAHLFPGTPSENLLDASQKGRLGKRPLDWPQVRAIRAAVARGVQQGDLANYYGVSQALISYIVNNRRWIESAEEATA
jgi:hypothetical protein